MGTPLLVYSDFYYPDENGIKRKTILSRPITVERKVRHVNWNADHAAKHL